jgi:hypothetical protein
MINGSSIYIISYFQSLFLKSHMTSFFFRLRFTFTGANVVSHWDESRARDVVAEFHAAALRSALWPSALQNLAALTGAEGCMLAGGPTSSVAPICSPP